MSAAPLADASSAVPKLVDLLLAEQKLDSAVDRFSERHVDADAPLQERYYNDLIPTGLPGEGQQFAFRVDLDACTGCKACVTACHSMNGLGLGETWRDVGSLVGGTEEEPLLQTVTTACHHCEDPACLAGCPVKAYEKDPVTGIVRHLDDQCIGCQYCILKCPYDVPKFDQTLGIVRKCDMCAGRLAAGEAPACVQGCPNEAISIELVDRAVERPVALLPVVRDGMPESSYTRPTTRYVSRRTPTESWRPADSESVTPAHGHTPLAFMLVTVQLSVGLFLASLILIGLGPEFLLLVSFDSHATVRSNLAEIAHVAAVVAVVVALLGQAGALFHLGRPLYAFRAVLGWRTSWMSREILVFGAYTGLIAAYVASRWMASLALNWGVSEGTWTLAVGGVAIAASLTGLLGILASVMIYADTHRAFWSIPRSAFRFFGTAVVLGSLGLMLCVLAWAFFAPAAVLASPEAYYDISALLCGFAVISILAKLRGGGGALGPLREEQSSTLKRSALLLAGPLNGIRRTRQALGVIGGVMMPLAILGVFSTVGFTSATSTGLAMALASVGFGLSLAGEFLERHLFFRAEASRAMPGMG